MHANRSKYAWIAAAWKQEWYAPGPTRVHRHISDTGEGVKGEYISAYMIIRLRTGVGRYRASVKKWGLEDCAACECGEPEKATSST